MAYIVSLKEFDGPLDLLLTLISNAKIDIHDIFVSQITEQYLETMSLVDELDMDSASEFLQMAATLLEIKSRAMLPKPPKPEDPDELSPEEALIKQLEEYRQFKEVSSRMKQLEEEVAQDPEASGAMNNMIAKRKRVEEVLSTKNMKPDDLAQASLEMEAAETAMNSNEKIQALKAARKDFSDMMNNVNRILRLVITGEVEEDDFSATVSCGGNCANCSGCS